MTSDISLVEPTYFVVSTICLLSECRDIFLLRYHLSATTNYNCWPKYDSVPITLPAADYVTKQSFAIQFWSVILIKLRRLKQSTNLPKSGPAGAIFWNVGLFFGPFCSFLGKMTALRQVNCLTKGVVAQWCPFECFCYSVYSLSQNTTSKVPTGVIFCTFGSYFGPYCLFLAKHLRCGKRIAWLKLL